MKILEVAPEHIEDVEFHPDCTWTFPAVKEPVFKVGESLTPLPCLYTRQNRKRVLWFACWVTFPYTQGKSVN